MYDNELHDYLNQRNNQIDQNEYLHVCNTCPQLNHIKYDNYNDIFEAWSDGGEYFKFGVHYKGEN